MTTCSLLSRKLNAFLILSLLLLTVLSIGSVQLAVVNANSSNSDKASDLLTELGDFEVLGSVFDFDSRVRTTIAVDPYPIAYYPYQIEMLSPYYASIRAHGIKYMTYGTFMAMETNYGEFVKHYNVTPGNFEDKITGVNLEGEHYRYIEPDVNGWPTMGFTCRSFWREVIMNVTKLAIDAGVDMVVYDGGWGSYPGALTGQLGDPGRYVFDNESTVGFRQYLANKYNSTELLEKFGIADISNFNFTQYLIDKGYTTGTLDPVIYENLPSGLTPPDKQTMYLWREYENYNLKVLLDFYDRLSLELKSYAQSKGRSFWIAANLKPTLSYHNVEGRLSIIPFMTHVDFPFFEIWYDDIEYPKRNIAPLLRTMYATGKHFASMTSPTPSFSDYFNSSNPYPEEQVLATAELIACGGWPQTQLHNLTYIRFIQQHPELLPKEEHGKVALIYSLPSAQNYRAPQSFLNYYHSLYWGYLPYEAAFYLLSDMNNVSFKVIIFGDNEFYPYTPTLEELSKYEAIILPNTTCLSDSQVNLLLQYVQQGGVLIGIGTIGICDENGFPVSRPEFTSYFNASGWPGSEGSVKIYSYGNGKIVSITDQLLTEYVNGRYSLYYDYEFPPDEREALLSEDYYMYIGWLINWFNSILNTVGIQPDISTNLNQFVMIIQYWDSSANTMLFHFVNYEYGLYEDKAIDQINANFTFTLKPELQGKNLRISFYTPENPDGEILSYTIEPDGRIKVTIPRIHIWGILKVEEEKAEPPTYTINTPTEWSGNVLLNGHLIVNSNLTIVNSVVEIQTVPNSTVKIEVLEDGSLKIINSTIRPYNESNHYYIRVHKGAKFYVENSTIEGAGIWGPLDVGGVWVETWDTIVLRSIFRNCYQYGLFLMEANYTFIEDSNFINCTEGIMLYQTYFAKIVNSTFINNTIGLYAKHTHDLDLSKCTFVNNPMFGAIVDRSEFAVFRDSYFTGSEWDGLSFWTSIFTEVINCTSYGNGYGYTFRNTPVSTILNSDSYNNVYSGVLLRDVNSWSVMPPPVFLGYSDLPESLDYLARGDYLPSNVIGGWDGSETIISHSNISFNGEGISISCSGYFNEYIRIVNNTIRENNIGLSINDTSNSIIIGNNFINNIVQAIASNVNIDFNATNYGNYWSDYVGPGPYQVYDNIYDYHPLSAPNIVADVHDTAPPRIDILEEKWVDGWDADGVNDTLELIIQLQDETSFYTDPQDKVGWVNLVKPRPIEDGAYWNRLGIFNQTCAYSIFPPEEPMQPNNVTINFGSGDYFHELSSEETQYVKYDVYASDVYGNWAENDTASPHITVVKYGSGSLKVKAVVFDSSSIENVVLHYSTDGVNYQSTPMTYNPEDETYECVIQDLPPGKLWFYISAADIYNNYGETQVFTYVIEVAAVVTVSVEATWNEVAEELSLAATATCNVCGEISSGIVRYEILTSGEVSTGIEGDMTYNTTTSRWEATVSTRELPLGEYIAKVTVTDEAGHSGEGQTTFLIEDTLGPLTSEVTVTPAIASVSITVAANITDFNRRSNVAAAELFIDTIGGNGAGTPLNPIDGAFDSPSENVEGIVDISGLSEGLHTVYVHGVDAQGNWGSFESQTFIVDKIPPSISNVQVMPSIGSPGTIFTINAMVSDSSGVKTVKAYIQSPDEVNVAVVELYDDGAHGDGRAGDNIYGNTWNSSGANVGTYYVDIEAMDVANNINESENAATFKIAYGTETSTGTGTAYFETDSGAIEELTSVSEETLPLEGKPNVEFPHGFFSFNITGLSPGQTVTVTIILPSDTPIGTQYWKYQTPEGWYQIPIGDDDGDNVITIQLTDGGLGDDDGEANGVIVDVGGPGIPRVSVGGVLTTLTIGAEAILHVITVIVALFAVIVLTYATLRRLS